MRRPIRELSSRVNINVHRLPNRLRQSAWWLALSTGVGSLLWLTMQFVQGENRLYQSGELSTAHRMFENECSRCHTEWTPLKRLFAFDSQLHATSTSNQKCETCHLVSKHQEGNKLAGHEVMQCAECHQEHQGREKLARPKNEFCVRCHKDLKYHDGQGAFENKITGFDVRGGHPDFLVNRLLDKSLAAPTGKRTERSEGLAVEKFQRSGEEDQLSRWQDRGRIRFNHARHLHARRGDDGELVEGLLDENSKLVDLSNNCETCHQPDPDHRFFKPIQFEAHCCRCHPLLFDPLNYPRQSVPHEVPEIIRGFLTETYTLRALRGAAVPIQAPPQQFCAALPRLEKDPPNPAVDEEADQQRRPLPGHRDQQELTKELAVGVLVEVHRAEAVLLGPRHVGAGNKATGGCRYCHEVEPNPAPHLDDWRIVPTQIPSRWLPHGEFHHEPHRLMSCAVCHVEVAVSENTGDVLIPSRDICLACHAAKPAEWVKKWEAWFDGKQKMIQEREDELIQKRKKWGGDATVTPADEVKVEAATPVRRIVSFQELLKNADRGTRTDCVECHTYHNPALDKWNGPFVPTRTKPPNP